MRNAFGEKKKRTKQRMLTPGNVHMESVNKKTLHHQKPYASNNKMILTTFNSLVLNYINHYFSMTLEQSTLYMCRACAANPNTQYLSLRII